MHELRFAFRQLRKNPVFATLAVLTLGLGIGVNTSMFTGLQELLHPELPWPQSDRLVRVFRTTPHSQRSPHSPAYFLDLLERNDLFERVAAMDVRTYNLSVEGRPAARVRGLAASADYLGVLGVAPLLGRGFTAEEDHPGADAVAILSHSFWQRHFGADPDIVGRNLRLDGTTVTVIGVMPAGVLSSRHWGPADLLRPLALTAQQRQNRGGYYLGVLGRLKPGLSFADAQAGITTLAARLREDHPEANAENGLRLASLGGGSMDPRGRLMLGLIMGLAGFVLLIACANLANLQFARTASRVRELAIRGALGAPRHRVLRQLLLESLIIAAGGGMVGLLLAVGCNRVLRTQLLADGEPLMTLQLNPVVLGFCLVISTLTGLAFGLAPAWGASRVDPQAALQHGARGIAGNRSQRRLRQGLIVLQVALALMLLAGAGLVIHGLQRFGQRDPGWRVEGVTAGYLSLPESHYGSIPRKTAFIQRLQEKIAGLPGAQAAAVAHTLPLSGFRTSTHLIVEDRPEPPAGHRSLRQVAFVSPGYFATLGMQLLEGRDFQPDDTADRPAVVIVNQAIAHAFWPDGSAVGKRLGFPGAWQEIVGVVNDVGFPSDPSEPATRFQSYRPLGQEPQASLAVAVRGPVSPDTLRRAVAELDSDLPLSDAGTLLAVTRRTLDQASVAGWLLGGFALLGLLLAALGIYGVLAGYVAQRVSEIGVRMALGAQSPDVLRLVIGRGLRLTLLGAAIGSLGALGMTRVLLSLAPGLEGNAPGVVILVTVLLVAVALGACWLPARRAARLDPVDALRTE